MFNFFKNKQYFKDKFNFKEDCYLKIGSDNRGFEETLDEENIKENLEKLGLDERIYSTFNKDKIIIKAFEFEENLQIIDFLAKKTLEIDKGIEVLKKISKNVQIKVVGDIYISGIERIKAKDKLIQFKEKEFIELAYKNSIIEEVLILDLVDLVYLGEAFLTKRKKEFVYITVSGQAISKNCIIKVKIDEKLETIFNELSGDEEKLSSIISGGYIKGIPRKSLNERIGQRERGVLFLTEKEKNIGERKTCIRCGRCLKVCSEKLNPTKLVDLYRKGDKEEFLKFGGMNCIECGLCTIVCPSNIQISHSIKVCKLGLREKEKVRSESFV
ncbi:MAG: 4Fe-4S dicluster domain-containing protein [Clostridium sp.]